MADICKDSPSDACSESKTPEPAMTPQQRRFTSRSGGRLGTYKDLLVGEKGWGTFSAFELYNFLFSNTPSILGVALRYATLSRLLKSYGSGSVLGRGVSLRQPHRIALGRSVIIDDYVSLDVRSNHGSERESGIECGDNIFVGKHSIIAAKGAVIRLGNAVNISSHCRIATTSGIEIEDSVLIAAYAYIGPGNHSLDDKDIPLIEQAMEDRGGVRIGERSWIGARATILEGVTIGREAIVGAHSLVTKDVPERAIVAGTPAKIIRYRD